MQHTVKMSFILPFIRHWEHQMAGHIRMTKVPLVLVCHWVERRAMFHLTISHSSSVWIRLVTSPGSLWRDLIFQFIPLNAALWVEVSGSVNICLTWQRWSLKRSSAATALNAAVRVLMRMQLTLVLFEFGRGSASAEWNRRWHSVLICHFNHMHVGQESCSESH